MISQRPVISRALAFTMPLCCVAALSVVGCARRPAPTTAASDASRPERSTPPREGEIDFDATTTERGEVVFLVERFFFASGQVELSEDAEPAVARTAARLNERRFRRRHISVEGHSDASGRPEDNLRLSIERAEAVGELLVQHGVDASRIHTRGFGATRPLVPERRANGRESAEARARNRRVDVVLDDSVRDMTSQ